MAYQVMLVYRLSLKKVFYLSIFDNFKVFGFKKCHEKGQSKNQIH